MNLDTELDSLLASAADTHHVDFVEVPIYDQETAEVSAVKRIRCRGANLFELARFFKRFPEVFKLITDQMDTDPNAAADNEKSAKTMKAMLELVLQIPEAIGALNSCFVGRPFNEKTEAGFAVMSNDANLPILERGLFKSFDGDIAGFFAKRGGGLMKAMGIKMTMKSKTSPVPSSTKSALTAAS